MADDKTYTEAEHIAILADRVAKETESLSTEKADLLSAKTELETKLDVTESAKVAAEQRAEEAEKALEDYKAEVTEEREAAARKDDRLAKVRESAGHLGDEFFKDEARITRICAMTEEGFEGYLEDLKATAKVPAGTTSTVPRETAMAGQEPAPAGTSVSRDFLLRRYLAPVKEA